MNNLKWSNLIIYISNIDVDTISYYTRNDPYREYKYQIPYTSDFDYNSLKPKTYYAIVAIKPDSVWFWLEAHELSNYANPIMDHSMQDYIALNIDPTLQHMVRNNE